MNWFQKLMCKWFNIGCPSTPAPGTPPAGTPPSGPSRSGLEYAYYGMSITDPPQIAGHVTMAHIATWAWNLVSFDEMMDTIVTDAKAAKAAGIFKLMWTLDFCLFTKGSPKHSLPRGTQVNNLINFFNRIRDENLLEQTRAIYVIDEPNISANQLSAADVTGACNAIRDVASHYLMTMPPLAIIYGQSNGHYPGIESLDWAGFDNYGAPIFSNGEYNHLKAQLSLQQKSIIVPGGMDPWREDPNPFYNFAQANLEVGMIMPFMWFNNPPTESNGIVSNGMAPAYIEVGNAVKAGNP